MTQARPTQNPVDPLVGQLARDVAQVINRESRLNQSTAMHYQRLWTIFLGHAAYARLRANGQDMVVGYRWIDRHGLEGGFRQEGPVDQWSVYGIPVQRDPAGPHHLWRLAGQDGFTLAWGDWS